MNGKYRNPESKKEIYSLFERENCEGAFVWEYTDEQRIIHDVLGMGLNKVNDTLDLKLNKSLDYRDSGEIYIYHPFRETVSKAKYLAHFEDHLSLLLPESIKTLDTRLMPRFKFRPKDEKFVTLKFDSKLTSLASQELKFQLIDISQSGLAVCISHKNKEMLKYAQNFLLTHLGKIPLPKPITISNVYTKPFSYKTRGKKVKTNRAGFTFDGSLKKFVLNAFAEQND